MTEVTDVEVTPVQPVDEALALIDEGLGGLSERQLISTNEVTNLLLDVRSLLSSSDDES